MLCVLPTGQVVKADMQVDGRVEVRCAQCNSLLYHDAIFSDYVAWQVEEHKPVCSLPPVPAEPVHD